MSQSSVTIEFLGGYVTAQDPSPQSALGLGLEIRVVESIDNLQRIFTLSAPKRPAYTLTQEETDRLLELCSQITVTAPWQGQMGFDGMTSILTLHGARSQMTFSWWGDVPAEWQSVGAVFDHVMDISDASNSNT